MRKIICFVLCIILSGCAWGAGGGEYHYERYMPDTGEKVSICVKSTREIGSVYIHFSDNGTAEVRMQGIVPGPDNLALALGTIDTIVKAGTSVAAPGL